MMGPRTFAIKTDQRAEQHYPALYHNIRATRAQMINLLAQSLRLHSSLFMITTLEVVAPQEEGTSSQAFRPTVLPSP
jgi:hypothetical protein